MTVSARKSDTLTRGAAVLFASTLFVASGLLFLVQPMFARLVLPRLGGSASVWNACVLFFQAALLAGYMYAHCSTNRLGVRRQALVHLGVVLLPLLALPLGIGSSNPSTRGNPVVWLLATMVVSVGAPFFVLSTTAPLLQRWFATLPVPSARDPYFLYSASNLGSMLALLSYPFAIEPAVGVLNQTRGWSIGYCVFLAMIAACAVTVRRLAARGKQAEGAGDRLEQSSGKVTATRRFRWILLSFVPSSLMLGVTLHISTDIAAVPLLWVLPLAFYLLTFVFAFADHQTRIVDWARLAGAPLVIASLLTILLNAHHWSFILLHLSTFFCCAMVCHSALAETRPSIDHLTEFYLWISIGGMLGGVFNTLAAPEIFSTVFEYPLLLAIAAFLMPTRGAAVPRALALTVSLALVICIVVLVVAGSSMTVFRTLIAVIVGALATLAIAGAANTLRAPALAILLLILWWPPLSGGKSLFTGRSFFGVVRVIESADHSHRVLRHGSTIHGWQQLPAEGRCEPSGYYHPRGPIGDVFRSLERPPADVAVVGLGAGALGCYAERGQQWTLIEIDPLVQSVAMEGSLFTYVKNSLGDMRVVIGDGRLAVQETPPGAYDIIIIDAFSSDAIPVHLLTDEAIALYMSRLKPHGLLALHISNRYLRLERVVGAICRRQILHCLSKNDSLIPSIDVEIGRMQANWIVITRDPQALSSLSTLPGWLGPTTRSGDPVWSDDYSNLFSVLKLN